MIASLCCCCCSVIVKEHLFGFEHFIRKSDLSFVGATSYDGYIVHGTGMYSGERFSDYYRYLASYRAVLYSDGTFSYSFAYNDDCEIDCSGYPSYDFYSLGYPHDYNFYFLEV